MSKDYYNILGVSRTATPEEIKSAFRKKAHEYYPDKGGDAEKFKEINEAYQVLSNAQKRQQYDRFGSSFQNNGQAGFNGGFNMDFEDLGDIFGGFGDIFGFGGQMRGAKRPVRGRDLEMGLTLDFMDAAFGLEKELSFAKNITCRHCQGQGAEPGSKIDTCSTCHGSGRVTQVQRTILGNIQTQSTCQACGGEGQMISRPCSTCRGTGLERDNVKLKVKIPAGIDNGESIRLSGQGEAGPKKSPPGDLYLRIKVSPHRRFKREGYDVRSEETISIKQAVLGDKLAVETVHGELQLKIPEGTQSGTIFKLKDKGIAQLHGRGHGDHYVKVSVRIPAGLSKKQRQLLGELDI